MPPGMTAVTPVNPILPGTVSTPVTFSTDATVAPGNYTVTIKLTSATLVKTTTWPITVLNVSMSVTPTARNVLPGASGTFAGTMIWGAGSTPVSLTFTAPGTPADATLTFSPSNRESAGSTLTVATTASTPQITYPFRMEATGNVIVTSQPLSLTVGSDFTLAATAPAAVNSGSSTTSTVTVAGLGGFSGPVTFAASGLPAGATATFAPTTVTGSGTTTMTIATLLSTPGGASTVTVTATSGTLVKTANVTLTVRGFALSASPATQTVVPGSTTGNYVVTLTMGGGFNSTVTFGAASLPAGATATFTPASATANATSNLKIATTAAVASVRAAISSRTWSRSIASPRW